MIASWRYGIWWRPRCCRMGDRRSWLLIRQVQRCIRLIRIVTMQQMMVIRSTSPASLTALARTMLWTEANQAQSIVFNNLITFGRIALLKFRTIYQRMKLSACIALAFVTRGIRVPLHSGLGGLRCCETFTVRFRRFRLWFSLFNQRLFTILGELHGRGAIVQKFCNRFIRWIRTSISYRSIKISTRFVIKTIVYHKR